MIAFEIEGRGVPWCDVIRHAKIHQNLGFASAARRSMIIAYECQKRGIEATSTELQDAADRFRRRNALFAALETELWLQNAGLTIEDLERVARDEVLAAKLREVVTRSELDELAIRLPPELSFVELSRIAVEDEGIARELVDLIRTGTEDFAVLARRYSIDRDATVEGRLPTTCVFELPTDLLSAVATSKTGDLIGPVLGRGWEIYRIDAVHSPNMDQNTQMAVQRKVFERWLREREALSPLKG